MEVNLKWAEGVFAMQGGLRAWWCQGARAEKESLADGLRGGELGGAHGCSL